jgi:transcriptional regulator with AAA-type ATPase domain
LPRQGFTWVIGQRRLAVSIRHHARDRHGTAGVQCTGGTASALPVRETQLGYAQRRRNALLGCSDSYDVLADGSFLERAREGGAVAEQIDDPAASRTHCCIEVGVDHLEIHDAGSRHGTWQNGVVVTAKAKLHHGDLIGVGETLFVVVLDVELATVPPAASPSGSVAMTGSTWLNRAITLALRFGPSDLNLLITGETGTGKEGVARLVHEASGRTGVLLAVNCAAIPRELAETQFFGYRKGAFSGATEGADGFFAAAKEGTLFLDEVADLDQTIQAKLLRVLETGDYFPVGTTAVRKSTARVIAAASREVRALVEQGTFRTDLYQRLAGVEIWVPPLRERVEEIPLLLRAFLSEGAGPQRTSKDAFTALLLHPYPGNVRELRRVVLAAALRAKDAGRDAIELDDLALPSSSAMAAAVCEPLIRAKPPGLDELKRALTTHKGNVSKVAAELGVHRAQIYRVLKEHDLSSESFRDD